MKTFILAICLLLSISFVQAQPEETPGLAQTELLRDHARDAINKLNNPAGKIDLSSPEATVRSFAWANNLGDMKLASQCVQDPAPYEKLRDFEMFMKPYFQVVQFRVDDFRTYVQGPIPNTSATVTLSLSYVGDFGKDVDVSPTSDRLHLMLQNKLWLIVPDEHFTSLELTGRNEDMLAQQAFFIANPDAFNDRREYAMSQSCQSNMRQLGAATGQFVLDSNGKFPQNLDLKKQLKPYVIGERIYLCPQDKLQIGYSLNAEIQNKPLFTLNARTIMLYEGKDQQVEFPHRYSGHERTNIVFVDGSIQSFTREEFEQGLKDASIFCKQ